MVGAPRARAGPGDRIVLDARAKLNLGLEVVRKRADGYHEIRTLMQTIDLNDRITIRSIAGKDIRFRCLGADLPTDDRNLVVRAARLLGQETGCDRGAEITLRKWIPVGAGLGGGSSDAAATLAGLNRVWRLRLSSSDLVRIAGNLGSDTPFFIRGGTQLASGRGEILTPMRALPPIPVAVIDPTLYMSTASVYGSRNIRLTPHGPLSRLLTCDLTSRSRALSCITELHNDLERVVERRVGKVARLLRDLRACGSEVARITGSGSCIFVLAGSERELDRLLAEVATRDCRVYRTRFVRRGWFSGVPRGA